MQDALLTLLIAVVAVAAVISTYALATSGRSWLQIGKGGLDAPEGSAAPHEIPSDRDEEIRDLLASLDARRAERGEAPLNIDAELVEMRLASGDEDLRDELRALAEGRNRARARDGLWPLDVDAEIERRLRELT